MADSSLPCVMSKASVKTSGVVKTVGYSRLSSAQSSVRLFWRGVPVRRSQQSVVSGQ